MAKHVSLPKTLKNNIAKNNIQIFDTVDIPNIEHSDTINGQDYLHDVDDFTAEYQMFIQNLKNQNSKESLITELTNYIESIFFINIPDIDIKQDIENLLQYYTINKEDNSNEQISETL